MNVLLLNQDWFAVSLKELGHRVVTCGFHSGCDVVLHTVLLHIDTIIHRCPDGFVPDVIVYSDNSGPVTVVGLDETPIPTLFYSVDVHHHFDLHKHLGHIFDGLFVAQKDYIPALRAAGVPAEWLPLWASHPVEPSQEKDIDAVFVGTMDRKLNPERVAFFSELEKHVPLVCAMGKWWEIFPKSRVVLNQTVKGDLNFRVFEALMSGSFLLTEHCENGFPELFVDGQHLVTYQRNNVPEAAEKIRYYLEHPIERERIAEAGRAEALARHQEIHRTLELMKVLSNLKKRSVLHRHFSMMVNFSALAHPLSRVDTYSSRLALLSAMTAAEKALRFEEPLSDELSWHLCRSAVMYDREFRSNAGRELLARMDEAYPEFPLITLCRIRELLNNGEIETARRLATQIADEGVEVVFSRAEEAIRILIPMGELQ